MQLRFAPHSVQALRCVLYASHLNHTLTVSGDPQGSSRVSIESGDGVGLAPHDVALTMSTSPSHPIHHPAAVLHALLRQTENDSVSARVRVLEQAESFSSDLFSAVRPFLAMPASGGGGGVSPCHLSCRRLLSSLDALQHNESMLDLIEADPFAFASYFPYLQLCVTLGLPESDFGPIHEIVTAAASSETHVMRRALDEVMSPHFTALVSPAEPEATTTTFKRMVDFMSQEQPPHVTALLRQPGAGKGVRVVRQDNPWRERV
eukprot:PhM_4_TR2280/c0_g1_i1/m.15137